MQFHCRPLQNLINVVSKLQFPGDLKHFSTSSIYSNSSPIKLSYSIFDPKNGPSSSQPTMIILHGMFGSKKNFESLSKVFAMKTGFRVVTADVRNHGDSPHTPEMNYKTMSKDLMLLIKDLQIDRTILLGHSMGGKIAMTFALTQPQLVETLIVEDIAPTKSRSVEVSGFPTYIAAMENVVFNPSITSMANARKTADFQLTSIFPDSRVRSFVLTNLEKKDGRFGWRINLDAIKNHLEDLVAFPSFGDRRYLGNVLFIGGSESPQIREEHYPEIKSMFPNAVIEHLQGAGHWAHADKPQEFTRVITTLIVIYFGELHCAPTDSTCTLSTDCKSGFYCSKNLERCIQCECSKARKTLKICEKEPNCHGDGPLLYCGSSTICGNGRFCDPETRKCKSCGDICRTGNEDDCIREITCRSNTTVSEEISPVKEEQVLNWKWLLLLLLVLVPGTAIIGYFIHKQRNKSGRAGKRPVPETQENTSTLFVPTQVSPIIDASNIQLLPVQCETMSTNVSHNTDISSSPLIPVQNETI